MRELSDWTPEEFAAVFPTGCATCAGPSRETVGMVCSTHTLIADAYRRAQKRIGFWHA